QQQRLPRQRCSLTLDCPHVCTLSPCPVFFIMRSVKVPLRPHSAWKCTCERKHSKSENKCRQTGWERTREERMQSTHLAHPDVCVCVCVSPPLSEKTGLTLWDCSGSDRY